MRPTTLAFSERMRLESENLPPLTALPSSQVPRDPVIASTMDRIVPLLRWFLADAERRGHARKYWIVDPVVGLYNTVLHHTMRLMSIDACSNLGAFLSFYSPFFFRDAEIEQLLDAKGYKDILSAQG